MGCLDREGIRRFMAAMVPREVVGGWRNVGCVGNCGVVKRTVMAVNVAQGSCFSATVDWCRCLGVSFKVFIVRGIGLRRSILSWGMSGRRGCRQSVGIRMWDDVGGGDEL